MDKYLKYDILAIIALPITLHMYTKFPISGYFRCDDSRLTFRVPESGERVPTDILFKSVLIPVIFIIFVIERHNSSPQHSTYFKCFKIYLRYFSAQAGNCVLNIILKTLASTPRPHFFSSCQPDWSLIDCHHNQGYVKFDASFCQSTIEEWRLLDSMRSFPSGHSQLAFCCATFFIVYLQGRPRPRPAPLLVLGGQAALVGVAGYCGLSRLLDHRHHPEDVLAGAGLGAGLGALAASTVVP